MSTKKEWLKNEILELIDIYHARPELWNIKSKAYKDRARKSAALEEIARKFDTTVSEVSRKIHNLRNQFNAELKKNNSKKKSGQGTDEVFISQWPYFNALLFLQCSFVNRTSIGSMETENNHAEEIEVQIDSVEEIYEHIEENEEKTAINASKYHMQCNPSIKRKWELSKQTDEHIMNNVVSTSNEREDQYEIFGKYIASEMRSLSSDYLRKKMKRKLQQVIMEISEEEEHLARSVASSSFRCLK